MTDAEAAIHGFKAVVLSTVPPTLTGVSEDDDRISEDGRQVTEEPGVFDVEPKPEDRFKSAVTPDTRSFEEVLNRSYDMLRKGEIGGNSEWTPPAIGQNPSAILKNILQALNTCRDVTVPTTLQIKLNFVIHQGGAQGTHENGEQITCRPEGKMRVFQSKHQMPQIPGALSVPDVPEEGHWFDGLTGVPIQKVKTTNGSDDTADGERGAVDSSGAGEAV